MRVRGIAWPSQDACHGSRERREAGVGAQGRDAQLWDIAASFTEHVYGFDEPIGAGRPHSTLSHIGAGRPHSTLSHIGAGRPHSTLSHIGAGRPHSTLAYHTSGRPHSTLAYHTSGRPQRLVLQSSPQ